jgi:predicted kinase
VNRFVVVSGLPASGKSTVAKALAASLELPLLDKDTLLEALFETTSVPDVQIRRELSLRADSEFQKQASRAGSAVLASWWKHPRSPVDSGTPTEWLARLPGTHVEVHCNCSPAAAAERFVSRKRHPGHLDGRWSNLELLASFKQQASFGPLGFGRLIEVETESTLELSALLRTVAQVFTERVL